MGEDSTPDLHAVVHEAIKESLEEHFDIPAGHSALVADAGADGAAKQYHRMGHK